MPIRQRNLFYPPLPCLDTPLPPARVGDSMSKLTALSTAGLTALMGLTGMTLVVGLPASSQAAFIYTSRDGWSVEGDPNNATESTAAEQMGKAEAFEASGEWDSAVGAYRALVKSFPNSALTPKAQLKLGHSLEQQNEFEKAYEAYETYLTKHPGGSDFATVVESMFRIAKLFMDGQKRKVFGIAFAPSMERAQEMFGGILRSAPYSKWAPLAQFNQGQVFEKQGRGPEAIAAYRSVVTRYSSDEIADDALYQIGYVLLKEFREGSNDRASAEKAREAFEDFINRYPESEKVAQAKENLKSLETGDVKGVLEVAKFYDRTKSYKAAVIYYNDVLKAQPSSPEAGYAKARIAELRDKVGDDSLKAGSEKPETGEKVGIRRRLQSRINTVSRPDYVGPMVALPSEDVAPPKRPKLRTSSPDIEPVTPGTEPPLPEPELPKKAE
jgi:outer membrane protein assembly factor BamD